MLLYVSKGGVIYPHPAAESISVEEFERQIKSNSGKQEVNLGWVKLRDVEGWYHDRSDEELVGFVASGNIDKLSDFIVTEDKKEYLRNLRFDADGVATQFYGDCSGWCLLNVAAAKGKPDMVDFLVDKVGMNVNTICYGVTPLYCCFPSMHDGAKDNFSFERFMAAQKFIEKGADIAHQNTTRGLRVGSGRPSGTGVIHSAVRISDSELRVEALHFLAERMSNDQLAAKTASGEDALSHLINSHYSGLSREKLLLKPDVNLFLGRVVSREDFLGFGNAESFSAQPVAQKSEKAPER